MDQFKELMMGLAWTILRPKQLAHQDWFDENNEEIVKFLDNKPKAFIEWQNDMPSTSKKGLLQAPMEQGTERATHNAK